LQPRIEYVLQLTIYRGTHEIGGNCVELRTDSTRIVIDVGMPLVDKNGESFDSQTLEGKSVKELLDDGTLPPVPGLFDDQPPPDAILLSHAHSDHTGLIKYTNKEIPVHLSYGTSDMMYVALKFARQAGVGNARQRKFKAGESFQIGDFKVTAHSVDHSAFDSMAFIIEAKGRRILYSGDLRRHGRKPGMARDLIAAANERPIDAMLMEGTHAGARQKRTLTEKGLEENIVPIIGETAGILLACFSPLHVDRLVTFYKATMRAGRTFVIDPYAALVMNKAAQYCKIPDPARERTIRVYYNRDFENGYVRKKLKYVYEMFRSNRIGLDKLRSTPERFLMIFRPRMLEADFEDRLPQNACCVYSYWEGYLAKPQWSRLQEQVRLVGGEFKKAHTSGHIVPNDLRTFIQQVNPKMLVPIHTFGPAGFAELHPNVRLVDDGEGFTI
jgi:ribonuclease J